MSKSHLFPTTVADSLPKPAWLAEPEKLWPQWRAIDAAERKAQDVGWVKHFALTQNPRVVSPTSAAQSHRLAQQRRACSQRPQFAFCNRSGEGG